MYHLAANRKRLIKPETKAISAAFSFTVLIVISTFSPLFSFNMIYRPAYFATPDDERNLRPTRIIFPWENFLYYYTYQREFTQAAGAGSQATWEGTRWYGWIIPTTFLLTRVPTIYELNVTAIQASGLKNIAGYIYTIHSQRLLSSTGNSTVEYRYNDTRYVGFGNPFVWSLFWLLPIAAIFFAIRRKVSEIGLFSIIWMTVIYAPYIYIGQTLQRIVFPFYFLNALIALPLFAAWALQQARISEDAKIIVLATHITLVIMYFVYYFPLNVLRFP